MTASRTVFTARFETPDRIERGTDWTVACPVFLDAALVTPGASSTVEVFNESDVLVASGVVTVVADVAEFTILGSLTADEQLGEQWRIEWALEVSIGITRKFRNTASLVLRGLYPVIADLDLFRRSSALDPANSDRVITDRTSYQDVREEAWVWLDGMLVKKGRRPQLIMSSTDLREVHINKVLEMVYRDLSQRNEDAYLSTANTYQTLALQAFNALAFIYDADEDGHAENEKRVPAFGSIWLNGRGSRFPFGEFFNGT